MTHDEMCAVIQAHKEGKEIEVKGMHSITWSPATSPCWNFSHYDYRIKPIPQPKKLVKLGPADFPPGTVICNTAMAADTWMAVCAATNVCIYVINGDKYRYFYYSDLYHHDYQRSLDNGKTWLPCWREE
jgi:hypothetical protein